MRQYQDAAPASSRASTASSPSSWATACSPISAIRRRMRTGRARGPRRRSPSSRRSSGSADGTRAARVGIATGLVVVGEIIGSGTAQEQTIVGETPNLAARLQALAEPHGVLIAEHHAAAPGRAVRLRAPRRARAEGHSPSRCGVARVGRSETRSRFQAVREAARPLVGRAQETARLMPSAGGSRAAAKVRSSL